MASTHLVFFGTYTRSTSRGIYAARLDDETGRLTEAVVAAETPGPTWITFSPDKKFLYAAHPSKAQVIAYRVEAATGKLVALPLPVSAKTTAGAPCHLAVDATQRTIVAANYGDGFVATLPIHADGAVGEAEVIAHQGSGPNPKRQDKPHVHSVTLSPDNRHVIVCDLGLDKIFTYRLDAEASKLTPAEPAFVRTAPGSGPRHFKFGRDERFGYALTEMGATVDVFAYDRETGRLEPIQSTTTLPADFVGEKWAAEVRLHPNGTYLYASNRTHDSLAVFAIDQATGRVSPVEIVASGGKTPRNFELTANGKWLVCAHQDSDDVVVFRVDSTTGRLTRTPQGIRVPMAVCVLFFD